MQKISNRIISKPFILRRIREYLFFPDLLRNPFKQLKNNRAYSKKIAHKLMIIEK
jgi:hypothetical protein